MTWNEAFARLNSRVLSLFGGPVLVDGIEQTGIYSDEPIDTEAGYFKAHVLYFDKSLQSQIQKGSVIVMDSLQYRAKHPRIENGMLACELSRA